VIVLPTTPLSSETRDLSSEVLPLEWIPAGDLADALHLAYQDIKAHQTV